MKQIIVVLVLSIFLLGFGCASYQAPASQTASPSSAASGVPAAPTGAGSQAGQNSSAQAPSSPSAPAPPEPPAQSPSAPSAKAATIEISGFSFQPSSITVDAGTEVTWVNKDAAPHSATGDNGAFDTGTFPSGESRSFTFSAPGTYSYHCAIHTSMKGIVQVR